MPRKKSSPPPWKKPVRKKKQFIPKKTLKCSFEQIAEAFRINHGMIYATAHYLDINHVTLQRYMRRWPKLKKIQRMSKKTSVDRCEKTLFNLALDSNFDSPNKIRALLRILATYKKKLYGEENKTNTINTVNINTVNTPVITEEVKKEMLEKIKAGRKEAKLLEHKKENGLKELPGEVIDAEVIQPENTGSNNSKDGTVNPD